MENDQITSDSSEQSTGTEPVESIRKPARPRRKPAVKSDGGTQAAAETASPAEDTGSGAPEGVAPVTETEGTAPATAEAQDAGTPSGEAAKKPARRSRARKTVPTEDQPAGEQQSQDQSVLDLPTDEPAKDAPSASDDAPEGTPAPSPVVKRKRAPRKKAENAPAASPGGEGYQPEPEGAAGATSEDSGASPETPAADVDNEASGDNPGTGHLAEREEAVASAPAVQSSPISVLFQAPDLTEIRSSKAKAPSEVPAEPQRNSEADDDDEDSANRPRRSRRGRNRNRSRDTSGGNGGNADDESPDGGDDEAGSQSGPGQQKQDEAGNGDGVTSRRRRRRRRGESDLELSGGDDDDPPNTVTRVRAPRQHSEAPASDQVTSVKGSTRLEAKKQRRRESRETGRRRQVITEAEFLARRESVDRTMVVRQRDERIQIGVLEDGVLAEHFVSKTQQDSLIGNVYVGKVQNVLPSMEAAFVDIGRGRNAVLYAGEVNWDAANMGNAPRRIENALKSGDSVVVQVTKDPVGHKGARLTSQISLPGRYLVYVPGGSMTGISRKLPDVERNRLKKILKDRLPDNAGVIVRTAAEGASEEELTNDINRLRALWETIETNSKSNKTLPPELLYGEPDLTIKVVRDVFNEDFSKLIVSGEEAWDTIEAYVTYVAPDLVGRLEKWTKDEDIFAAWRLDEQITKALDRKVFLPSGGSLVIDRTEAMTVVDVNTGKFTGSGGNLEETVTKNNLEAAEEVVRQLRLRDIGGIIVIDFIDMVLESNRDLVLRRMVECLGRDRTKHQVAEVTSLGLVQMTRKRMGTGLLEVFGETCEHCAGRGIVTHEEPVEHRKQHALGTEHHQHHLRAEKQSRSEKKRSRKQKQQDYQEPAPKPVEEHPDDAGKQAKAEAARAALANIAAASHAAHADEDHRPEQSTANAGESGGRAADAGTSGRKDRRKDNAARNDDDADDTRGRAGDGDGSGTILTIHGEPVVVPKSGASEAAAEQESSRFTLKSLTEAFDSQPGAPARQESQDGRSGTAHPSAPARRPRRHRSASSAQGAANANPVEKYDDSQLARATKAVWSGAVASSGPAGPAGTQTAGAETQNSNKDVAEVEKPKAEEPFILGTGVPASEL
ncbi:Rne/Rng family ribonuclease [Arthrobacter sp. H14]|uniref:Rne/Rng family ribonuclease n=1 Tax=Arthrobacter sp. H14 TaxID=1312959 RepID=UPI0004AFEDC2|nr:Rne/Rng family ribonuclease [Arthrobacter sp. H14]